MAFPTTAPKYVDDCCSQPTPAQRTTDELPPGWTEEEIIHVFDEQKKYADQGWIDYMRSHTPMDLQPWLDDYIAAWLASTQPQPEPDDPNLAKVRNGDSVRVVSQLGGDIPGSPGLAAVTNGTIDFVQVSTGE